MIKKIILPFTVLSVCLLAGCGTSDANPVNNSTATNSSSTAVTNTNASTTSSSNMAGMDMSTPAGQLKMAYQDEMNGFDKIQTEVSNGDYSSATSTANALHDEFHAAILPALKAKKGDTYAEAIHSKYDALQDAVSSKDPKAISNEIEINTNNLKTVMGILGVDINN